MAPFSEVMSQLPGGRLITLHHFCHGKDRQSFALTGIDIYFYNRHLHNTNLPSLHAIFPPKLSFTDTQCLIYHHDIAHSIASDQENHFTAKRSAAVNLCS